MPEPWSQPNDVDRLVDRQADIAFEIPLSQLPRVQAKIAGAAGTVSGIAHFRREAGFRVAELELHGEAELVCQRCMAPMVWPLDGESRVAIVAAESDADRVPQEFETAHAEDDRIRVGDLVEEELLLTLPLVPLHAELADCEIKEEAPEPVPEEEGPVQETQRPFERLGELLKRNH